MRTTININIDILKKLKSNSDLINIHSDELIAMLLNMVISKDILKINIFKGVQYQKKDPENNWCKLHVKFDPRLYEVGLDFRKYCKVSVSLLISFAIVNFLDELIKKITESGINNKKMDNYPLNYIILAKMYDNIQGFIVLWGIPEEKTLKEIIP